MPSTVGDYFGTNTSMQTQSAGVSPASVETLLFVDIDGVLNVGIRDPSGNPLDLNELNLVNARKMWPTRQRRKARTCIERLVATGDRNLGYGEGSTYEKLVSDATTGVSDVLLARLARLIRSLGKQSRVVLSSTWRKPQHAKRLARLEAAISSHLGEPFAFHAKTDLDEDPSPGGRLAVIGDFISKHCATRDSALGLRVLVLEDFHLRAMGDWSCNGQNMDSIVAVEKYLEAQVPVHVKVCARVVHTYDEWVTEDGLPIQIGAGLTMEHFHRAQMFLGVCDTPIEQPLNYQGVLTGSQLNYSAIKELLMVDVGQVGKKQDSRPFYVYDPATSVSAGALRVGPDAAATGRYMPHSRGSNPCSLLPYNLASEHRMMDAGIAA